MENKFYRRSVWNRFTREEQDYIRSLKQPKQRKRPGKKNPRDDPNEETAEREVNEVRTDEGSGDTQDDETTQFGRGAHSRGEPAKKKGKKEE